MNRNPSKAGLRGGPGGVKKTGTSKFMVDDYFMIGDDGS
jgi:hypothetical protein